MGDRNTTLNNIRFSDPLYIYLSKHRVDLGRLFVLYYTGIYTEAGVAI